MRRLFLCLALAATGLAVAGLVRSASPVPLPSLAPGSPTRETMGMNLSGLVDWTREWALVDAFKLSRPWILHGVDKVSGGPGGLKLGPGQSVDTLMMTSQEGHYPGGRYVVTYRGKGKVDLSRFDVAKVVKQVPGRVEVDVKPGNGGLLMVIHESDPKDPVRDLHVYLPGFEKAKSPFHPVFLDRLKPFGVIRFMDWQHTNNSPLVSWSERAKPEDDRYTTEAGMPLEIMIDLANTLKADPWFCMPHLADDDFVRNFARMVKERLDPARKVHVEYSNEVWNFGFGQTRWAHDQGVKRGLGNPQHHRFYAQRSVEMFAIWEEVFGGTARLVRILGSQASNPWADEQILGWKDAAKHADALAVAPYFGYRFGDPKTAAEVARMSVPALLDAATEEIEGDGQDLVRQHAQIARKHRLRLFAYESGQHLTGFGGAEGNQALTDLLMAANRHPRMYDLYRLQIKNWFKNGGDLFVSFSNVVAPTKWGSWGVLEFQDQPIAEAPKYRAIIDSLRASAATAPSPEGSAPRQDVR